MKDRNLAEYIGYLEERVAEKREAEMKKRHEKFVAEVEAEEKRRQAEQDELDRIAHKIILQEQHEEEIERMRMQYIAEEEAKARKYGWIR